MFAIPALLSPSCIHPGTNRNHPDSLLLCFGALAVSQAIGVLPETGRLIYGEGHRHKTVKIRDHTVRSTI